MKVKVLTVAFLTAILIPASAVFAQELDARGGADGFGYIWIDSEEWDGPDFDWIDMSNDGTEITDMDDDDFAGPIDLPWNFSFYENEYDEIYICSNGFLKFGGGSTEARNQWIPDEDNPDNIIALYWCDLDPSDNGAIYYGEDDDGNWVCQFDDISVSDLDDNFTGEIILHQNGEITFQYDDVPEANEEEFATVGIENDDGSIGLHIFSWENRWYPYAELAIRVSLLETDASVSGTVTDVDTGEPIANAFIRFSYWDDEIEYNFEATSDDDGNYEMALISGTYWVTAGAEGYGEYGADGVEIDEGENTFDIEMGPPPIISIDPEELELFAAPGTEGDPGVLTIANEGGSVLFFFIMIGDDPEPHREWLRVEPWEGMVEPDEEMEVEFTPDARNLEVGEYEMNAIIWSNDPENELLELPVTLFVGADPPADFDLLSPEDGEALGTGYIELSWEESEEVTPGVPVIYDVYVSGDPDNLGEPVARNLDDTACLYNAGQRGTHYWTVYAKVIEDVGTWASSINSFTAGLRPPEEFDLLLPENGSRYDPGEIILVWQTPRDPDNDDLTYDIFISTDPDNVDDPYQSGLTEAFFVFDATDEFVFYWTVHANDGFTEGTRATSIRHFAIGDATGVSDESVEPIPDRFAIESLYPNPFNPTLHAVIAVPQSSDIRATVFDILGRQVAMLHQGKMQPGYHSLHWTADSPSGVYFLRISSSTGWNEMRKVVFIK